LENKDKYGARFGQKIDHTIVNLKSCPASDRAALDRLLRLWHENGVIPLTVAPSVSVASPRTPPGLAPESNRMRKPLSGKNPVFGDSVV
jgi:hypothetical protein